MINGFYTLMREKFGASDWDLNPENYIIEDNTKKLRANKKKTVYNVSCDSHSIPQFHTDGRGIRSIFCFR